MKQKIFNKKIIHIAIAIIAIIIISTYSIGTYFIEFALVPNKGGGERDSATSSAQKNAEGYEEPSKELAVKIALARKIDSSLCDEWLKAIKSNIKRVNEGLANA